jgi:neutral ceramidase
MTRAGILALLAAACAKASPPVTLPAVASGAPAQPSAARDLIAGIGRADITPPPGLGLAGRGPEGRVAAGYRHRLYVRALFLEDSRGERVVFVVADLPFVSALVHRRAAELLEPRTGIGADRLILAATHTHAGPGNIEDWRLHNELASASSVSGYDSAFAGRVAAAIAAAAVEAVDSARPARIRSGATAVWGLTRNRSLVAYQRNPSHPANMSPPPGLDSAAAAVDPTLTMLRVDLREPGDSVFRPSAAFSIFPIHATGDPAENDLYDGDIHAVVERTLERHIDSLAGLPATARRAVHLFANGAEGDVSPAMPPGSWCASPRLTPERLHGGQRAPRGWEWRPPGSRGPCLEAARLAIAFIGDSLGRTAVRLFDALEPGRDGPELLIARAARTLPLAHPGAPSELCAEPAAGSAFMGGAEDGPTRYRGGRWLGFIPSSWEEGERAVRNPPSGCQAEKRTGTSKFIRKLKGGPHSLPEVAQLAVVRMGGLLLAVVPAEVTTAVGWELSDAVRSGAVETGAPPERVAILGLANGYIQYVATEEEYRAQHYEGAMTIYGPATARVLARELHELAAAMGGPVPTSPPDEQLPITVYPGPPRHLLPRPGIGARVQRAVLRVECDRHEIIAEWRDLAPADLLPTNDWLLTFRDRGEGAGAEPVAWDDRPDVEVRPLGSMKDGGWRWQARWRPAIPGRYQLVLPARAGLPEVAGPVCTTGAGTGSNSPSVQ